jgi:hypothetical protein
MVSNYGERADEVATELAYYFQQANRPHEAAHYLAVASEFSFAARTVMDESRTA